MKNLDTLMIGLYGLITIFFIYRIIKQKRQKIHLTGEIHGFKRPVSSIEWILFVILIATGIFNLYQGYKLGKTNSMITAAIMIILSVVFVIFTTGKFYMSDNGLIVNSAFTTYKELRKWAFDERAGELVMAIKKDKTTVRESIKIRKDDIDEINSLIRKYKLGK